MRELGPLHNAAPAFPLATAAIAPLRAAAEQASLGDFSPLWCGQNLSTLRVDGALGAAEVTRDLARGLLAG
jgi:nitronate monooxygenase